MLYHYAVWYFPAIEPGRYSHLLDKGYLAVDMFFMLSGFVMTHVYWRTFVKKGGNHYWAFLSARIARLYPLHLFVLALFLAIAVAFRGFHYAATGTFEAIPMEGARSLIHCLSGFSLHAALDLARIHTGQSGAGGSRRCGSLALFLADRQQLRPVGRTASTRSVPARISARHFALRRLQVERGSELAPT
ncbi:MAG: acyltransferase [Rhizobiales bacterium]|nr:acyltransferase [Hyphomicrobiales bacterium]